MINIREIVDFDVFNPNLIFEVYKEQEEYDHFELNDFKKFVDKYIEESKIFNKETSIPRILYPNKINLALFEKRKFNGYINVKDIYAYFDDENNAIFLKNNKQIDKVKKVKQLDNWLVSKLDELLSKNNESKKNNEIDKELYLSTNFKINKSGKILIRSYIDALYDVIIKYNNTYYSFFSIDNIDEYSFNFVAETDIIKMKRILKLNKIKLKFTS